MIDGVLVYEYGIFLVVIGVVYDGDNGVVISGKFVEV